MEAGVSGLNCTPSVCLPGHAADVYKRQGGNLLLAYSRPLPLHGEGRAGGVAHITDADGMHPRRKPDGLYRIGCLLYTSSTLMTNDIKALIDYYEREKGLSREKILLALESAFLAAYRKMVPGSGSINYLRAEINVDKGKVRIFADLEVVPDEEYSDKFLSLIHIWNRAEFIQLLYCAPCNVTET